AGRKIQSARRRCSGMARGAFGEDGTHAFLQVGRRRGGRLRPRHQDAAHKSGETRCPPKPTVPRPPLLRFLLLPIYRRNRQHAKQKTKSRAKTQRRKERQTKKSKWE